MFCQSCGKEVNVTGSFCDSCGKSIQNLTSNNTPQHQQQQTVSVPAATTKHSHKKRNIGIIAGAVIVILVVALLVAALSPSINITGVNLNVNYTGITSGYFGPGTQSLGSSVSLSGGNQFTETITFTDSAILLTHSINSINVNTPGFVLISTAPSTPISLTPGSSVTITLTIQAPNSAYNGPLLISVSTS